MILLTRLDGNALVVNADQIVTVQAVPDTVIGLIHERHVMVLETVAQVYGKILHYKRFLHQTWPVKCFVRIPDLDNDYDWAKEKGLCLVDELDGDVLASYEYLTAPLDDVL